MAKKRGSSKANTKPIPKSHEIKARLYSLLAIAREIGLPSYVGRRRPKPPKMPLYFLVVPNVGEIHLVEEKQGFRLHLQARKSFKQLVKKGGFQLLEEKASR